MVLSSLRLTEDAAKASEDAAAAIEGRVMTLESSCTQSASDAEDSVELARKWAEWTTGATEPSATNNAKYWAEQAADWSSHDASHLTYTFQDGTVVNLADLLKVLEEDADGGTLLLL